MIPLHRSKMFPCGEGVDRNGIAISKAEEKENFLVLIHGFAAFPIRGF
jgi:hypothetical protein